MGNIFVNNRRILKIAEFGSAAFFDPCCKHLMTSCVITSWYRPPELLLGEIDYGIGVHLWSVGCVLGELLLGKPIIPGCTEVKHIFLDFAGILFFSGTILPLNNTQIIGFLFN
ncbi:hypothetical protein Scep_019932 [Stephania cephalantha]|uniref:Protein kinase domain-containing protein n=1 Tax=Stephania cephalantha TaxID=152367 RepID=A0AAP0IC46_9MAGN